MVLKLGARFAVHVEGLICSALDKPVHVEFSRLLREELGQARVTGCVTTWILGMKIDHDREKMTTTLSQGMLARKLLGAFGVGESMKSASNPLR